MIEVIINGMAAILMGGIVLLFIRVNERNWEKKKRDEKKASKHASHHPS